MQTVGELVEQLLEYDPDTEIDVECASCGVGSDGNAETLRIKNGIKRITICVNK